MFSAILKFGLATALPATLPAQSLLYEIRGDATRLVTSTVLHAGDLDRDGSGDLLIHTGRDLDLYSGKTGKFARRVARPGSVTDLDAGRDADGDGVPDVLIGQDGLVTLRSGKDGSVLRTWRSVYPGDRFGAHVAFLDDVDGDKLPDVFVAARGRWSYDPASATRGFFAIYSSKKGTELRRQQLGYSTDLVSVDTGGDHDGDGSRDVVYGFVYHVRHCWRSSCIEYSSSGVALWSHATSQVRNLHMDASEVGRAAPGYSVVAIDDSDHDRADDVLRGHAGRGVVYATSGKTAKTLHTHSAPGVSTALASLGDLNHDGIEEYAIGTALFDGKTHSVVFQPNDAKLTRALDAGDLNGDGRSEVVFTTNANKLLAYTWAARPGTRAGFAQLLEPTGKPVFREGFLEGTSPPVPGTTLAISVDAQGYHFAVILIGLGPHPGKIAPIPGNPLLLYLQEPLLLPFAFPVGLVRGRGSLSFPLPKLAVLIGADLGFQAALFSTSGPGAFGATNLLLANAGLLDPKGSSHFETGLTFSIDAGANLRDRLGTPVRLLHNRRNAFFVTLVGSKPAGIGPLELRTASGKPPTGGGLLLGTIAKAAAAFELRLWIPPGTGTPIGLYVLNRDSRSVALRLDEVRIE